MIDLISHIMFQSFVLSLHLLQVFCNSCSNIQLNSNLILFIVKILQQVHSEKTKHLLEQISCFEGEAAANRDAAEKLLVLKNELGVVNQSNADLKKSIEALEKSHSSTIEIQSNLENSLTEKNHLISSLEKEVKDLTEEKRKESECHVLEMEKFLNKEKRLKEQLEAAKQSVTAAKAELSSRREEIKTMKTTLSAASHGLEERDSTIKSLKEKLNKAEAEQAKTSDLLKEKVVAMNKIKVSYLCIYYIQYAAYFNVNNTQ